MATWAIVLITIGIVLAVGSLVYVIFRWGKKSSITKIALTGASVILNVLSSLFKDKPDELDAHDFIVASGELTAACLETLKASEAGVAFEDLEESMTARVRAIVDAFPNMDEKVSDELIEKSVDAFFMLVNNIPKVNDIVKK